MYGPSLIGFEADLTIDVEVYVLTADLQTRLAPQNISQGQQHTEICASNS